MNKYYFRNSFKIVLNTILNYIININDQLF